MTRSEVPGLTFIVAGDPQQLTGGYLYDARIVASLRDRGWQIDVLGLAGRFPDPDARAAEALDAALAALADGSRVIIDGLALGGLPQVAERHCARLHMLALLHHLLADETGRSAASRARLLATEKHALENVSGVITTSHFSARRLREIGVDARRLRVVEPGVDPASVAQGSDGGTCALLCVASLIPRKGHEVLVDALAEIRDLDWRCDCVGALDRDPAHATAIARRIRRAGLDDRIHLRGPLGAKALANAYDGAELFVLASHYEGYGMVISEALAHGLPVVTTTGGALAQTLPENAGTKVAPGDAPALAAALRTLVSEPAARHRARQNAIGARAGLTDWPRAGAKFASVLAAYARTPQPA